MQIFKNIDLKKFLDNSYLFEKTPESKSSYLYLAILFGLLILLAIGSWYYYQRNSKKIPLFRKLRGRVFNLFLYTGIFGIFLIFCRYEGIAYLGSRFFMLLLVWVFIIWAIYIINYRFRVLPREIQSYKKEKDFEKYLPRKKSI